MLLTITIIPIMLHQTSLHPRLATIQYIDFTKRESRPWYSLIETLNELVNDYIARQDTKE